MKAFVFQWRAELDKDKFKTRLPTGHYLLPWGFFVDLEPGICEINGVDQPIWIAQNIPSALQGKLDPRFLAEEERILERTCWRNFRQYRHQQIYTTPSIGSGELDFWEDGGRDDFLMFNSIPYLRGLAEAEARVYEDYIDTITNPWKKDKP